MQQMNQIFCKKQKRGKLTYKMLITAKVEVDPFVEEKKHLAMDEKKSWVKH
jgi:hypothetical protein